MYFYYLSITFNHFGVHTPSGSLHQISAEKHLQWYIHSSRRKFARIWCPYGGNQFTPNQC